MGINNLRDFREQQTEPRLGKLKKSHNTSDPDGVQFFDVDRNLTALRYQEDSDVGWRLQRGTRVKLLTSQAGCMQASEFVTRLRRRPQRSCHMT
jgi:hypothetical protein